MVAEKQAICNRARLLRIVARRYLMQWLARPKFKNESIRTNKYRAETQDDIGRIEHQIQYVLVKNNNRQNTHQPSNPTPKSHTREQVHTQTYRKITSAYNKSDYYAGTGPSPTSRTDPHEQDKVEAVAEHNISSIRTTFIMN